MRQKVVYVAGPFRAANQWQQFQNIRRAETLAFEVWRLGAVAICPHLNTAHFQDALPDKVWLDGDLEIVRRCDAVVLVAGWERSQGAKLEKQLAHELGIPVFGPYTGGWPYLGGYRQFEVPPGSLVVKWFTDWLKA